MLIYAYADILGYRDMLKKHKSCEIYNILNNAINDMHMLLNKYLNSDLVLEEYKFGLYLQTDLYDKILYNLSKTEEDYVKLKSASIKNPDCNKIRNEYRNYQTLYNQIDASSLTFKSYIAFDTIVIYWDKFEYSEINMKVFLLAIDLLYMLLYDKDILIRGAIGCTDDFHIDEEGNERFFLINNIDVASEIEHSQNSANLIVFGNELHNCCQSITGNGITDDYYTRTPCPITEREKQFAKDHPDQQIIYFKDGYYTQIITGKDKKGNDAKTAVTALDLFGQECNESTIYVYCVTICPINNLTLSYLGIELFERVYKKAKKIYDNGPGENDHPREIQYNTACFLLSRLNSCMFNGPFVMDLFHRSTSELPVPDKNILNLWAVLKARVESPKTN